MIVYTTPYCYKFIRKLKKTKGDIMKLDTSNLDLVKKYNDFVRNSPYGHHMQDTHWSIVKNTWKSVYFYKEKDGQIIAALSIIYIHDSKVDSNFYYAPRGPVCDLNDIDLVKSLIDEASEYIREKGGFLLRLDPEYVYDEELTEKYRKEGLIFVRDHASCSQPLRSLILDINGRDIDEIFKNFSKNTRKHIRSSYRNDIVTTKYGRERLDDFYETIRVMAERAGIGHRDKAYFERLFDAYGDDIRMTFSELDGEVLCVSMMICYGKKCFAIYGASNNKHRNMNQNYQINYEEAKYAADNAYEEYDMGGIFSVDEDDGLYGFKKKFTEDNVKNRIGELDIIFDKEKYLKFRRADNPDFSLENL